MVVAHTGVNWEMVGVIGGLIIGGLTLAWAVFSFQFGRWSEGLGHRLDNQDAKIESMATISSETATDVARIEGWLSGAAGQSYLARDK